MRQKKTDLNHQVINIYGTDSLYYEQRLKCLHLKHLHARRDKSDFIEMYTV